MSRKPLIAGNWKMNKTPAESVVLSQGISNRYSRKWNKVDVVLPADNRFALGVHGARFRQVEY